jgi:hypothetical protein
LQLLNASNATTSRDFPPSRFSTFHTTQHAVENANELNYKQISKQFEAPQSAEQLKSRKIRVNFQLEHFAPTPPQFPPPCEFDSEAAMLHRNDCCEKLLRSIVCEQKSSTIKGIESRSLLLITKANEALQPTKETTIRHV